MSSRSASGAGRARALWRRGRTGGPMTVRRLTRRAGLLLLTLALLATACGPGARPGPGAAGGRTAAGAGDAPAAAAPNAFAVAKTLPLDELYAKAKDEG